VYTRIDPGSVKYPAGSPAHLLLVPNPEHNSEGDFDLEHDRLKLRSPDIGNSGMTYSGMGIYTRSIFNKPGLDDAELGPMIRKMLAQGYKVTGELRKEYWIDVGTRERLELARSLAPGKSLE